MPLKCPLQHQVHREPSFGSKYCSKQHRNAPSSSSKFAAQTGGRGAPPPFLGRCLLSSCFQKKLAPFPTPRSMVPPSQATAVQSKLIQPHQWKKNEKNTRASLPIHLNRAPFPSLIWPVRALPSILSPPSNLGACHCFCCLMAILICLLSCDSDYTRKICSLV